MVSNQMVPGSFSRRREVTIRQEHDLTVSLDVAPTPPPHSAGPNQAQGDDTVCHRSHFTWKKRIMFHISPRTREGLPSAISAASMLTSLTCREAIEELNVGLSRRLQPVPL